MASILVRAAGLAIYSLQSKATPAWTISEELSEWVARDSLHIVYCTQSGCHRGANMQPQTDARLEQQPGYDVHDAGRALTESVMTACQAPGLWQHQHQAFVTFVLV